MIHNKLHDKGTMRGFTLLELLFAVSLLAIGMLAVSAMQGVAIKTNIQANRISVATLVGQQVVEDLSSLTVADPLLHTTAMNVTYSRMFDPATSASTASTVSITGAGTFSAQYDIAPNTPMAGTTYISVRVFYSGSPSPLIMYSTYKRVV